MMKSLPDPRGSRLFQLAAVPATIAALGAMFSLLGSGFWLLLPPSPIAQAKVDASPVMSSTIPLEIKPDPSELGVLKRGQQAESQIEVRNPGPSPFAIGHIETSCPCVRFAPGMFQVGPGEVKRLAVRFDPSDEPDFRGGLSVVVRGYDDVGQTAFETRVNLEVR